MSKLDFERPKYEWERVHPDQLDEEVMIRFADGSDTTNVEIFIKYGGKKWTFWRHTNSNSPLYITIYPVKLSFFKGKPKVYKVAIGSYYHDEFVKWSDKSFPGLPFHIEGRTIQIYYEENRNYNLEKFPSINEYIKAIYQPLIMLLMQRKIIKI